MKINLHGVSKRHDGFGIAGKRMQQSLENLGYEITDEAKVSLSFAHPHSGRLTDGYDILYMPWESTLPLPGWIKYMHMYDEIWVTSPWLHKVAGTWGFDSWVYEHGIDPIWNPVYRQPQDKIRFLMVGFEALRKGGLETLGAFRKAFGDREDVELVIKTQSKAMSNVLVYNNVRFITEDLPIEELVELYHSCHVFLAPSYGEGFGIPARDAMGTGMPVIHTRGFAPYEKHMNDDLLIDSDLVDSPWPKLHPGWMYQPNENHLVDIMKRTVDEYSYYSQDSFNRSFMIHDDYQWDDLTAKAFRHISPDLL